ncbi:MAG: hypothetical protein CMF96_11275 [Candidatus Marinimicrobia bacterium]|mgnify:CR=1 FL=1|nr:hypothetical protein [Candidatus Neomarinimicrobiota bacterium]|tara:strand:- start:12219 stop:12803 length:585 start_codon:yes stop_codon:yes gene_type:complete
MYKILLILLLVLIVGCYDSSSKYREPSFDLIKKDKNIEIREYNNNLIIKTSKSNSNGQGNSSMFRVLANYIFGANSNNEKIPMTAPVITKQSQKKNYEMIFFILNKNSIDELPIPKDKSVIIDSLNLYKTISISFGMWASDNRINKYKKKLNDYIKENSVEVDSNLMVAQYNSPWVIPPFRKNELIYKIKYKNI